MNHGKIAYEAYCKTTGNKSLIFGAELPSWEKLDPEIQESWNAAGKAAVMSVHESSMKDSGNLTEAARRGFEGIQYSPRVTCSLGHVYEANPYKPCPICAEEDKIAERMTGTGRRVV